MRVISGKARGLKLESPDGLDTRPTLDRVKEALFNIIFPKVPDSVVLDLFAGSGALGIEALSRNASHCTFVDSGKNAIDVVKSNLKKAKFSEDADVIFNDSLKFLEETCAKFDIIFLDPPYKAGLYEKVFSIIKKRKLLKNGGIVTAECDSLTELNTQGYNVVRNRVYGKIRIYILEDLA